MTEAPQFRVFLKQFQETPRLNQLFKEGVPCESFYALDADQLIPKTFVFVIDHPLCSLEQYDQLDKFCKINTKHTYLTEDDHPLLILADDVIKVIDPTGNEGYLELIKQAWIVSNHVSKLDDLEIKLNGEVSHIVLMGLQQALFIDAEPRKSLNPLFFDLAIHLIKDLSQENETLKEYLITPFSCEYINQAKALLFPE